MKQSAIIILFILLMLVSFDGTQPFDHKNVFLKTLMYTAKHNSLSSLVLKLFLNMYTNQTLQDGKIICYSSAFF